MNGLQKNSYGPQKINCVAPEKRFLYQKKNVCMTCLLSDDGQKSEPTVAYKD